MTTPILSSESKAILSKYISICRIASAIFLALALPYHLTAAGPAPVNLRSTSSFVILSGAAITSTGGGIITGNVGASPITGAAIGVTCAQVVGTIYEVDASGPACAIIDTAKLTTAKGDLTLAYDEARDRTPVPTGPNLNPGLTPGAGNIGGMVLPPGLYKFTTTALITGSDVTLTGGADDVWIFQCAQDLQVGSGIKVILAGGAQAKNVYWQVGTSAVLDTFSVFKGTIMADQAITMNTSSTIDGRLLAFSAGVTFNGDGAALPVAPEIAVSEPPGNDLVDGVSTVDFGPVLIGTNASLNFTITNSGDGNLTGLGITIDGADASQFTVTSNPTAPVIPGGSTTFTVQFTPLTPGLKAAALHIANNDSDENPFDIFLAGTAVTPTPKIGVSQPAGTALTNGVSSRDFGAPLIGTTASLIFTITNSGTANLTGLGITIDGIDASSFTVTVNPVAPLSPNGSTPFTVRFAPLTSGLKSAALHIANNDNTANPFTIFLTGTGSAVPAPIIGVMQPAGTNLVNNLSSRDFGAPLIGASSSLIFTITNSGTANLTGLGITIDGTDASLFTVTVNPVAPLSPNGSTPFTIRFAPLTSGLKAAALHIANNDNTGNPFTIFLTGTGSAVPVPIIGVMQPAGTALLNNVSSRDFGAPLIGGSTSLIFTITNSGTANLTGLGITIDGADASQFTVTVNPVAPLSPNGRTPFTVRFTPLTLGLKVAALHIANNDSTANPFTINLTGIGTVVPFPIIGVSQPAGTPLVDGVSSRDFGSPLIGASTSLIFTITNSGTANLTGLGITIDGADASLFTVTVNPVAPLSPNGSTPFTVRFAPLSPGAKTAALHIASNDNAANPFDIILTGTGTIIPTPTIGVLQPAGVPLVDGVSSRDFGAPLLGNSTSLIFTITNSGTANLTGLGITIDGADASLFTVTANPVAPVVPSGSTTFTVRFAPLTTGAKTAALHIANNDSAANPFDIILTGTGTIVPTPTIGVLQPAGVPLVDGVSSRDFGAPLIGNSTSLTFTITNSGTANLTGLGITIDGTDASLFTITANPAAPVVPNGSTTFTVQFAPLSQGGKVAALHIANNDNAANPFDIILTGTGTTVPTPQIEVSQPVGTDLVDGVSSRDFGLVIVGANNSLTFTISNPGTANLTGLGITIDGADASQFSVTANPVAPVGPGGSTTFTVQFAPLSTGLKIAALHLANNVANVNPFDIILTGTGGPIIPPINVAITAISPITLNPQTGFFEQTVQVSNISAGPVAAIRLLIQDLPADVQVYNAGGTTNGIPFVEHDFPVAPAATVDFVIEYFRPSRVPIPQPAFVAQDMTPVTGSATGILIAIDRDLQLPSGRFLIEFSTIPGRTYAVQYSPDLTNWTTVIPTIIAPANKVQWYDDGPPKTISLPTAGNRFYRIVELP